MYFVFDIESVPDFDLLRDLLDNADPDDDLILELACEELTKSKTGFLPPMCHRMVSWVGLWIDNLGNPKQKAAWTGRDEKQGLVELCDALNTYKDFGLIHHNGRGFDLPLVTYRAMKHGLQLPLRLNNHEIKYRFSKENIDLIDQFSNFGASSWPKLKHIGTLVGIPVKKTGQGDQVLTMFREGELDKIERYCYEDVVATYLVWLHLKYTIGDMNKEHFDNLRDRAMQKLSEIQTDLDNA
ncbi:MAG: ribonuclease H-like domain-containing protein [Balneolales bacterium]